MRKIIELMILPYLVVGSIYDLKRQMIPVWYLALGTVGALCSSIYFESDGWYIWAAGGAAGVLFLIAAKMTKESIGYGDGWMITNLGIYCGIWKLSFLLFFTFAGAALAAGIGMFWKKWSRKKRIPLYPFLILGYIGGMVLW